MKIKLITTGFFYTETRKARLEELGFKFDKYEPRDGIKRPGYEFTKDSSHEVFLELSSLEELMEFSKKWGELVVDDGEIEIYDDYRE